MRIGMLGTAARIGRAPNAELLAELPATTVLSAWPSRVGVFPATPVERDLQAIGHLEAGLRAAAAGVDAAVIDSVGDYGLEALRVALAIPVAGAGEAGLTAAARHGRFAIVTVWPESMNFVPRGLLRTHGLETQCSGIRNLAPETVLDRVAGPDGYLDRIHRSERGIVGQVIAAIEAAAADGAAAVMLGCTCMSPMAAAIAAAVRVPVVNPLAEAARQAVAAAHAGGSPGPTVRSSRAGLIGRMVDAIAGEADEACPVCVIAGPS